MVATARCPDRSQLERFLRADLPDEDASGIDCHLAQCDSRAPPIHEVVRGDPLIKALQGGAVRTRPSDGSIPRRSGFARPAGPGAPPGPKR